MTWLKLWDSVVFGKDKVKKRETAEKPVQKKEKKYVYKEDDDWMVWYGMLQLNLTFLKTGEN